MYRSFSNISSIIQKHLAETSLHIEGPNPLQWTFLWSNFLESNLLNNFPKGIKVHILPNSSMVTEVYDILKFYDPNTTYLYPGLDISPYVPAYASESGWFDRINILSLSSTHSNKPINIVTTLEAALLKMPPRSWHTQNNFQIKVDDIIGPIDLSKKLVSIGYISNTFADTPGSFSKKGEVFDIYPTCGQAIRITYFDDLIEKIHPINLENNRSLNDHSIDQVIIGPGPYFFTSPDCLRSLRENLPNIETKEKERFEERRKIFESLQNNQLFPNYVLFSSLFFEKGECLFEQLPLNTSIFLLNSEKCTQEWLNLYESFLSDYNREKQDPGSSCLLPEPNSLYCSLDILKENKLRKTFYVDEHLNSINLKGDSEHHLSFCLDPIDKAIQNFSSLKTNRTQFHKNFFQCLKENHSYKQLTFIYKNDNALSEIKYLLDLYWEDYSTSGRIHFLPGALTKGFFYGPEDHLFISDSDIFSFKKRKTKDLPKISGGVDLFAEQISTLKQGDFVVHQKFGIGRYLGVENLDLGGKASDFLVLSYKDGDKVYVPVYKLDLVQKHSDADLGTRVADLKTHKFDKVKTRARESAKKLAFDLLKLQAERKLNTSHSFSAPDHLYHEFELEFPFQETPDQMRAIEDVIEDMQRNSAMDRLVCGDVGFGKTEVAMRAAFKAVEDKKQVVVLVPTTILALQHFHSFSNRFEKFPVQIDFLSRFKTPQESKKIIEKLESGNIDILIGTHKLLSDNIKFKDLGLLIIDEEQRFGVAHKEKIKLFKTNVDVLTLSATPIPRTLQLAFLGIRDLSLIKTPPARRQSIKTFIIKNDPTILGEAINREISRGGQVFYVHNRVQDIEIQAQYIRQISPNAKVLIAHGQLNEKELEARMEKFYRGDYNVLLSTTIIESGLDIPNANTMIVNQADTFGLSQLHQLRGRIGRSDKKAYAYFVISEHKQISEIAEKRLKALQTYADMGSGFNIATSDLEIRGAGDILGPDQSGHIDEIGLELYLDLLQEAIDELKGSKRQSQIDLEIQIPEPAFIPHDYIVASGERLKFYKKLSNARSISCLQEAFDEITDLYGHSPSELNTLMKLLEIRLILSGIGLKTMKVNGDKIYLQFDPDYLNSNEKIRNEVVQVFMSRPKIYKLNPNYSVIFTHKNQINLEYLIEFSKNIAGQIRPC